MLCCTGVNSHTHSEVIITQISGETSAQEKRLKLCNLGQFGLKSDERTETIERGKNYFPLTHPSSSVCAHVCAVGQHISEITVFSAETVCRKNCWQIDTRLGHNL